jgi:lipopolysaccharide transport system permease protein
MLFTRLWRHRALTLSLVRRQYQLRYRQSAFGVAWAIVPPLASLAVAVFVFHGVMGVDSPRPGVPYALITLAALVPWTFFAQSLTNGIPSIVGSIQMVTRLPFPRAVIPMSMVGTSLIDLCVSFVGFIVFALIIGNGVPATVVWLPSILAIEVVLIAGLVLLGSALNVFARDIRLAVPLLMQLWLFITPVMYSLDSVPSGLRWLYLLNPMTGVVEASREVLAYGEAPSVEILVPSIIGAMGAVLVGAWYFSATEERFADAI